MKSRLTIEVDFDNGNEPYIRCFLDHESDDVRDKLLKSFFQSLGHSSHELTVKYAEPQNNGTVIIFIKPVKPEDLRKQGLNMIERFDEFMQHVKK